MAIPLQSLSGTEVLRRGSVNAQSNTNTYLKFDNTATTAAGNQSNTVPANHIVTVLNVIFCEQGNNIEDLQMWVEGPHAQSIYLMNEQDISAYTTFVWDEKIVLVGGDSLRVSLKNNAGNVDIWYNYIDQSWV